MIADMVTLGTLGVALPLALGANPFGWTSDEAASHAVLDAYVAGGGSLIDTSDSYGAGASETIIGSWLARAGRRDDVVLATKVARHPERTGLAGANVLAAAEDSLRRLGVDRIDLYWAHFDDPQTPLEETLAAFEELVRAGKVRELGISNYSPDRIREWLAIADREGYQRPAALQPQYSLLRRREYEEERQALAVAEALGVLPYWGLASGLLTGKYRSADDVKGSSREGLVTRYADGPAAWAVVDLVREIAGDHRAEPGTVALAWLLSRDGVAAPIASVSRAEQLPGLLAAPTLALTDDELARLTAASDAVGQ